MGITVFILMLMIYCIKVELYALCNELNWYILLGEMGHDYLMFRAKRLIKIMKETDWNNA